MNGAGDDAELPIAIIGAGFAGIGTAIRLQQAGIRSFTIFERADEVGGTWRDNTYPGRGLRRALARLLALVRAEPGLDAPLLAVGRDPGATCCGWSRSGSCARTCACDTEIVEARFDEARGVWMLTTAQRRDASTRAW